MKIAIPYGDGALEAHLPDGLDVTVVGPGCGLGEESAPPAGPSAEDEQAEIRRALAEPIGAPRLSKLATGAHKAAIVVSDVTRPCPSYRFLPALLDELAPLCPGGRQHPLRARRSPRAHA